MWTYDNFSTFTDPTFYNVFWLNRGRHHASLQLCSRGLRDNAGVLVEFQLAEHSLVRPTPVFPWYWNFYVKQFPVISLIISVYGTHDFVLWWLIHDLVLCSMLTNNVLVFLVSLIWNCDLFCFGFILSWGWRQVGSWIMWVKD